MQNADMRPQHGGADEVGRWPAAGGLTNPAGG